jgi:excisionase family DNA binding protein
VAGELLIDVDEAAHRLAVCRRVVFRLIYDGVLPSVKIHRSRRIAVADLVHYVDELRANSTAAEGTQPLADRWHPAPSVDARRVARKAPETTKTPSGKLGALNNGGGSTSAPTAA